LMKVTTERRIFRRLSGKRLNLAVILKIRYLPASMAERNGFARNTVLGVADKVIEAVKAGAINHFLVGDCDGAKTGRNYYTEFVKKAPNDTVILTLACGKFRFNDLNIGEIGGLPRIMDMGHRSALQRRI
jgi:hydroxylamine reductase (hybrid-cluster protein)